MASQKAIYHLLKGITQCPNLYKGVKLCTLPGDEKRLRKKFNKWYRGALSKSEHEKCVVESSDDEKKESVGGGDLLKKGVK